MTLPWTRLLLALSALGVCACVAGTPPDPEPTDEPQLDPDHVSLPTEVRNLHFANTRYDDYNPIPFPGPTLFEGLLFSSNRATKGGTFDFTFCHLHVRWREDGSIRFTPGEEDNMPAQGAAELLGRVNTPADEFGPYLSAVSVEVVPGVLSGDRSFLFARDVDGQLDMHVLRDAPGQRSPSTPRPALGLNSPANDAYPSVDRARRRIYFTSDRGGDFDVYLAEARDPSQLPSDPGWLEQLLVTPGAARITPVPSLNSEHDDKCPFVLGDRLVFTSNRPGGYGGFDLYLASFDGQRWSEPRNLGPEINSPQDEYRPILISAPEFQNDLLVFSSNRSGGLGGFDLYYAGFPRAAASAAPLAKPRPRAEPRPE